MGTWGTITIGTTTATAALPVVQTFVANSSPSSHESAGSSSRSDTIGPFTVQANTRLVVAVSGDGDSSGIRYWKVTNDGTALTWTRLGKVGIAGSSQVEVHSAYITTQLTITLTVTETNSTGGTATATALFWDAGCWIVANAEAGTPTGNVLLEDTGGQPTGSLSVSQNSVMVMAACDWHATAGGLTLSTTGGVLDRDVGAGSGLVRSTFFHYNNQPTGTKTMGETAPTGQDSRMIALEIKPGPATIVAAPSAPTAVTPTAGNAQASVAFTPGSNGGATIDQYRVTPYINGVAGTPVTGSSSPIAVTRLSNGTAYTFTVAAHNSVGWSPESTASAAVTPAPPTVPGSPTNVTAVAGNGSASVSFNPPANTGGAAITLYRVTPYINGTAGTPVTGSSVPITVGGLTNGTTYTFTVAAQNSVGWSAESTVSGSITPSATTQSLRVSGNKLVDANGKTVTLRGVNISSAETWPAYGGGFYEAGVPNAMDDIARFGANVVRIPLNQGAWLGYISGTYCGQPYRDAITNLVAKARSLGLYVIVDLHWNDPRPTVTDLGTQANQQVMADAAHSVDFWTSVATNFMSDTGVIFDLYNEPHDITWDQWKNGGSSQTTIQAQGNASSITYTWTTAGMQQMMDAVRATGATNVVMCGGLGWANGVGADQYNSSVTGNGWDYYKPSDPTGNLALSWHAYPYQPYTNPNGTSFVASYAAPLVTLAQKYPIIVGETGDSTASPTAYLQDFMPWCEQNGISYLAWTFNAWGDGNNVVITQWNSTTQPFDPVLTAGEGTVFKPFISARHGVKPGMTNISRGKPCKASSNATNAGSAVDGSYGTWRSSGAMPQWWAIDLSTVPAAQRLNLYLQWWESGDTNYDTRQNPATTYNQVGAYTIQGNTAAGGGAAPTSGWVDLITVTGNTRRSRAHRFTNAAAAEGTPYNWLRINCTATAPTNDTTYNNDVEMGIEIFDCTSGAYDTWLVLGDSITADGVRYSVDPPFPAAVTTATSGKFIPAVEAGGAGYMKAADLNGGSQSLFLSWLDDSPAHFVTLNYGTNDVSGNVGDTTGTANFYTSMEYAVQQIIARGKVPVIPMIPWTQKGTTWNQSVQEYNAKITALYAAYPTIVQGPDFFTFFQNNPSYIPAGDVHPTNTGGYAAWANQYALAMASNVYN